MPFIRILNQTYCPESILNCIGWGVSFRILLMLHCPIVQWTEGQKFHKIEVLIHNFTL